LKRIKKALEGRKRLSRGDREAERRRDGPNPTSKYEERGKQYEKPNERGRADEKRNKKYLEKNERGGSGRRRRADVLLAEKMDTLEGWCYPEAERRSLFFVSTRKGGIREGKKALGVQGHREGTVEYFPGMIPMLSSGDAKNSRWGEGKAGGKWEKRGGKRNRFGGIESIDREANSIREVTRETWERTDKMKFRERHACLNNRVREAAKENDRLFEKERPPTGRHKHGEEARVHATGLLERRKARKRKRAVGKKGG